VEVNDKPTTVLPFTDTLICAGNKLPLAVQGSGATFSWKLLYNITNANTANPTVYPVDTTTYTITVMDKSCIDSASIQVNVLPFITVSLPKDLDKERRNQFHKVGVFKTKSNTTKNHSVT
jgi:hypothetical protein